MTTVVYAGGFAKKGEEEKAHFEELDKGCLEAHNQIRTNPKSFLPDLEAILASFEGNTMKNKFGEKVGTHEGPSAVKEAIDYLNSANPLPPLKWNKKISKAAEDHTKDIGPKGITGHDGSDGCTMEDRLLRHGLPESWMGECIDFGSKDGRSVVISLVIDDNVPSRGHRSNIFNPKY